MQRLPITTCLLLSALCFGQEFRATITGRVSDTSGAPVPNATVAIKNMATNEAHSAVSDHQGIYTIPLLRPGTYVLTVEMTGFKKFTREDLILNVGQTAAVNVTLEVGALTEQITVSGEAPLLDTQKADGGTVIGNKGIEELPLNARNPIMLSRLVSGVSNVGLIVFQEPFSHGAIDSWSINGSQDHGNEFLLDGAPDTGQAGANVVAYIPPIDSMQEFKIQTNLYDAQYGRTGGGIINMSLKSGTNSLHGTAYEFLRRNALDANSFQNEAYGQPKGGHLQDQYGFQLDGPMYFPKLYNGKNKSFFLFQFEKVRELYPEPLTVSVVEPEMIQGDFTKLKTAGGQQVTIYDPTTGRNVNNVWTRDPFPGNVIPQGRINPIAQKILGYMPKPNTKSAQDDYAQSNFFQPGGVNAERDDFYSLVIKFDENIGQRNRLFFRHASNDYNEMSSSNGLQGAYGESSAGNPTKKINDAYVLDWVGTVSPTFVANARLSVSRWKRGASGNANRGFDITTFGFPASLAAQIPGGKFFGRYNFSDYVTLGSFYDFTITNTLAFHPNITKIQGPHSIKAGVDMRWIQYIVQSSGSPFQLSSDRGFTQKDYTRGDALSGNSAASFLLGYPASGTVDNNVFPTYLFPYYAPWVQDDWKITRRLTVNLGLRWDFNIPPHERYDRMNRSFDAKAVNPANVLIDRSKFPDTPQLKGGLLFAGVSGVPRQATDTFMEALQPRFGFAYQVSAQMVVRGGWGRSYLTPNNDFLQTNGFSISTPLISTLDGGRTPIGNILSNPFPSGMQAAPGSSQGLSTFIGRGFNIVDPGFKLPHVNQFSIGFQYGLPFSSKIDVSYVGSRSKDLNGSKDFNYYDLSFRKKCNLMEGGNPLYCDQRVANPFQNVAPFAGTSMYSASTIAITQLALPYPEFSGITQVTRNDGAAWYNSLQVNFETRSKRGINILASYTLAKHIEQSGFLDVQNGVLQRSPYQWDQPQRLTLGAVYELPFGRGKKWLASSGGLVSRLVGGWEATSMFIVTPGRPWVLPSGVLYVKDAKLTPDWSADKVQAVKPCVAKWNDDGSITMQPFSVQYGCTDYNFLIAPRYAPRLLPTRDGRIRQQTMPNLDISLNKQTRVTEKTSLQFRAEAFNVTNVFAVYNQNFNNNTNSSQFGSLIRANVGSFNSSAPRFVQIAVKLMF